MTGDPGASAERTRLAWRRTGLSITIVALLAVRPVFAADGPMEVLVAVAAMLCWVAAVALGYRRTRGLTTRPPRPGRGTVVACAALTVGFAVIGGLVVTL